MNPYFPLYRVHRAVRHLLSRIHPSKTPQLSNAQLKYLDLLAARVSKKTPGSRARCVGSRGFLADPRAAYFTEDTKANPLGAVAYALVGTRGSGARIWDVDGNEYLDCLMGFGVQLCGHGPSFLSDAVHRAAAAGPPLGALCHDAHEVAERIVRLTGVDRVGFCNSGTEAVMYAIRLARASTNRKKFVVFAPSYHGGCAEAVHALCLANGSPPGIRRDLIVMDYSTDSLDWLERFGRDVAGVIVEPVRSRNPGEDTEDFLRELRRITHRHDSALIFDEVMLGFRIALGGAQEWFGIRADLVTYGKILGGGLPIGVVAGNRRFMALVDSGTPQDIMFRGTFNRNPFTMAASLGILRHLEEQGPSLQENLNAATTKFVQRLRSQFIEDCFSVRVDNFGSMIRFLDPYGPVFYQHLLERGIHTSQEGMAFLSTAHGEAELEEFFQAAVASAREMQAAGFS